MKSIANKIKILHDDYDYKEGGRQQRIHHYKYEEKSVNSLLLMKHVLHGISKYG